MHNIETMRLVRLDSQTRIPQTTPGKLLQMADKNFH